jgi:hypothetical protein
MTPTIHTRTVRQALRDLARDLAERAATRRPRGQFCLLLRDARGRFMRVLPTLAELAAAAVRPRPPRRPRPSVSDMQLTLF